MKVTKARVNERQPEEATWVETGDFVINIRASERGVVVYIYRSGEEMYEPVVSAHALTDYFEEGESK